MTYQLDDIASIQDHYFEKDLDFGVDLPRDKKRNNAQGGDRFRPSQYGLMYGKYLPRWVGKKPVYVEIGILCGTGMAVLNDYFINADMYGFDCYLDNYYDNQNRLKLRGAFKNSKPQVYPYDSYEDNKKMINYLFSDKKINIIVDDADHKVESMLIHLETFVPYIDTKNFLYIIEDTGRYKDTKSLSEQLKDKFIECYTGQKDSDIRFEFHKSYMVFSSYSQ